MEAEREVLGRWDEPHDTQGDLDGRIDQRLERRFLSSLGFLRRSAVQGEDPRPEVKRMNKLPVVDRLVGILATPVSS